LIYYEFSKEKPISEINKGISEKKIIKQRHVAAPVRAMWHADVSMMSSGGPGLLTSALGPADGSVDRSALTGQRSTVKVGPRSTGPTGQPSPEADRWAPRVRPEKEKEKVRPGCGLNFSWAGSIGPTGLGSARGSAWPAAQQAGSGRWADWLVLALLRFLGRDKLMASSFRLLLLVGLGCLCSFSSR
jgi:hypothetical protein